MMRKVEDYRRRAEECRRLAVSAAGDEAKQQLLQMADSRDDLARSRADQLARHERIAKSKQGN
jgi:hypothetical protein